MSSLCFNVSCVLERGFLRYSLLVGWFDVFVLFEFWDFLSGKYVGGEIVVFM